MKEGVRMATNTSRLGLLKKDTATDGNDTFNIKTMLNDNWDKIDAKVATLGADGKVPADQLSISVSDASTTQKGVVMLEDSVTSTSVTKAATPKSVKTVNDALDAHKTDLASQASGKGASLIGIQDSANQYTATTVEGALSELFTSVSNGKTQVANAITQKGQTASGSDTFAQLATSITAITTGKKFASGSLTLNSKSEFTVNGFDFTPSILVAWKANTGGFGLILMTTGSTLYDNIVQSSSGLTGATSKTFNLGSVVVGSSTNQFETGAYKWIVIE